MIARGAAWGAIWLAATLAWVACVLNPQPLPPGSDVSFGAAPSDAGGSSAAAADALDGYPSEVGSDAPSEAGDADEPDATLGDAAAEGG